MDMIATTSLLTVGSMAELGLGIAASIIPDADVVLFGEALEPAGIADPDLSASIDSYLSDPDKSYWRGTLGRMAFDPGRANYLGAVQDLLGRWGYRLPPRADQPEEFFVPALSASQIASAEIYADGGGVSPLRASRSILEMAGPFRRTPPPSDEGAGNPTEQFGAKDDLSSLGLGLLRAGRVEDFNQFRESMGKWRPSFHGASLRGLRLVGVNLRGADLRGADLTGADLKRAILARANLIGAKLGGADLSGADLSGALLRNTDFTGANLQLANLRGADFSKAKLDGANMDGALLSGAKNLTPEQLAAAASFARVHIRPDQREIVERALRMTPSAGEATVIGVGYVEEDDDARNPK